MNSLEMPKYFLLLTCLIISVFTQAQELNCRVQVLSPEVQLSNKKIFTTMETAVRDFMNNTRWTNDQFKRDERIEVNLTFTIRTFNQPDEMTGNLQIQIRRPVHNTNLGTILLNFMDEDVKLR